MRNIWTKHFDYFQGLKALKCHRTKRLICINYRSKWPLQKTFLRSTPLPPGFPKSSTPPPARISRIPSVGGVLIFSGTTHSETKKVITESQEAIDDFINQQKSANTNKKTATDMNTLLRYMEANGMKNEKIESLPASELDHLLSKFFLNARKKNGEEYEPATVSSFQRSIQRYLS